MNSKRASKHLPAGRQPCAVCSEVGALAISSVSGVLRYGAEDGVGSPPADCAPVSTTNSSGQYCPK